MKNVILINLLMIFYIIGGSAFAQNPKDVSNPSYYASQKSPVDAHKLLDQEASGGLSNNSELPGVPGSVYLNPGWEPGVITMYDGNRIKGNLFRYNLYTQQIQFIRDNDTLAIGNPEEITRVRISGRTFVYVPYIEKEELKKGYFELIQDGECRLLRRWQVLYHVRGESADNQTTNEGDLYMRDCSCYLQFGNKPAEKASKRKKEFLTCFNHNQDLIGDFIKSENLRLKDPEDLRSIVAYYNRIQE
nr:hypothetical protein [Bacteroidota bacterium]